MLEFWDMTQYNLVGRDQLFFRRSCISAYRCENHTSTKVLCHEVNIKSRSFFLQRLAVSLVLSSDRTATHVAVQLMEKVQLAPAMHAQQPRNRSEVRALEILGHYYLQLLIHLERESICICCSFKYLLSSYVLFKRLKICSKA